MAELTPKTINELPLASSLGANDLIPISSEGEAKRLPGSAVMAESGSGYAKFPDGLLILHGTTNFTSGSMIAYGNIYIATVTIALPASPKFINGDYTITGSSKWGTGAEFAIGQGATSATQASVRVWDIAPRTFSTSEPLVVKWMAVGRWK